jgi:aryl-alcohol dehydrogenase-like predicted oxidoreductase
MRGYLTGTPLERIAPREKWGRDHERAEAMRQWCEERGVSLLRLALHFCLREERIHGNPIGSLNIEQLEQNVAAVLEPLPEEVFAEFGKAGL